MEAIINAQQIQRGNFSLQAIEAPAKLDNRLLNRFIDYTDCKATTTKGYLSCMRQFMAWLAYKGIDRPGREDVKAYREHLKKSGYTVATQAQYMGAVKHFFKWTAAEGLYQNIAENVHSAKVRQDIHKKDALSCEDVQAIANSIDRSTEQGKRLYAMFLLCITCGLRTIEISRANVGDIKQTGARVYLWVQGKGRDDKDAPLLLVPEVMAALTDYIESRSDAPTAKSPLFASTSNRSKGGRIAPTTISTILKDMLKAAGYNSDRLTAHSLRHTSGTAAYITTHSLIEAQKHQRHADPKTTEIYIHAEEREERNTEQKIYNLFFKGEDQTAAAEAIDLIETLTPEQAAAVVNYIKALKGA